MNHTQKSITRVLDLSSSLKHKSILLLGPRRTGKSFYLRNQIKADKTIDLLISDNFQKFSFRPSLLREIIAPTDRLVIIDEIQKLPLLLDEVHALIEEKNVRFILTGSSARKLRRTHTSLMAGRARRVYFHPFSYSEVKKTFDLNRALLLGTLPSIYLQNDFTEAWRDLKDYAGDYLKEEILAEAIVRKIDSFSRFLTVAAQTNAELLNFEAVANDAQVPARTIREYYSVLEDTLIGSALEPYRFKKSLSRKSIATSKFYFFDCGVVNALLNRSSLGEDSPEFGHLFETWIYSELRSYFDYRKNRDDFEIRFWRNPQGQEVDFIINGETAIEVKATRHVSSSHLSGLETFHSIQKLKNKWIVSRDLQERDLKGTKVFPWKVFLNKLWADELF